MDNVADPWIHWELYPSPEKPVKRSSCNGSGAVLKLANAPAQSSNCGAEICRNSIVERCWTNYFARKPESELQHLHLGTMWQPAADGHINFTADTKHQHFHTMAHAQWQVLRPLHDLNLGLVLPLYRVIFFAAGGSGFCNRWGCWGPFECTHVMCSITCWWSWTWLFGQRKKGAQHVAPSLPGPFSPSPLHGI